MALTSSSTTNKSGDWAPLLSLAHIAVSYLGREKNDSGSSVDENISRPSSSSPLGSSSSVLAKTLSDGRSRKRLLDHFLEESADFQLDEQTTKLARSSPLSSQHQYYCEDCHKSYSTASNLSRHRQIHVARDAGETLACHTCGKRYVSQAALTMHQMTHDMANECLICGKKFSRLWLLQGHLRCHTQEKPFACEICGKSFADRSNLRVHTRLHSSAKSYSCPKCHRAFALKSYVTKHLDTCKGQPSPSSSSN